MTAELGNVAIGKLKGKRILITGASGFIGHNLAETLHKIGAHIYGTSREKKLSTKENFTWLQCSLSHFDETKEILEEVMPDIIYHFSGEVTESNDIKHVLPTFDSLVASTVNILTEATRLGCEKIILTGSCTEPTELESASGSPYAAAKCATRTYGNMFWQCYNTPVVIVRPFVGYGPGQSTGKLIPHVIASFLKGEGPKLTSGKWLSDWIYIDDVVDGIILSTITPEIEGSTIDLGTGLLTSVKDVVLKIKDIIRSNAAPQFGALPDRDNEFVRLADIEQTFSKINWKAKISLEEGLAKTIEAYRKKFDSEKSIS
jgi:nucleoside-diphosphate-sugar epimerase